MFVVVPDVEKQHWQNQVYLLLVGLGVQQHQTAAWLCELL